MTEEYGPAMQACTERERRFVMAYLENQCSDATDAARKAGCKDPGPHSSSIRVRGWELVHRPRVMQALQEVARTHFGGLLLPAVLAAEDLIMNRKSPDHAKMVLAVLSAQGLGDRTKVDVSLQGQIEVSTNRTENALDSLEYLIGMQVPEAKLLETFGYSGLARYRDMLEERWRKQGKSLPAPAVIEGTAVEVATNDE